MSSSEKVGDGRSSKSGPSTEDAVSEAIVLPDTGRIVKRIPRPDGFESFDSNVVGGVDFGFSLALVTSIGWDEARLGERLSIQDIMLGNLFELPEGDDGALGVVDDG